MEFACSASKMPQALCCPKLGLVDCVYPISQHHALGSPAAAWPHTVCPGHIVQRLVRQILGWSYMTRPSPALTMHCPVQDVIDLRFNAWVERRAVEGPKTISEIHRDAANEAMRKASSGRDFGGGRDRGGFGRDRGPPPMMCAACPPLVQVNASLRNFYSHAGNVFFNSLWPCPHAQ